MSVTSCTWLYCLHIQADVYVNTSNSSLDLSYGTIAKSLSDAGGPALQDECTKLIRANGAVAMWNIATTGGAKLMCKYVIHTVGDHYNGEPSQKVSFCLIIPLIQLLCRLSRIECVYALTVLVWQYNNYCSLFLGYGEND